MKSSYRLFFVMIVLSCCLNLASAQDPTEWMPDANLRTAVRQALNIDSDSSLTQQATQTLTTLNAGNSGITNITGLEHATALRVLNLSANQIRSVVPLEGLTDLVELNLDFNSIQSITPLEGLINLTRLNLGSNQIRDIAPLTLLTQITDLNLQNNTITHITPLTELEGILRLDLFGNQIQNITPLKDLTQISSLNLSENQISSITALAKLTRITRLDLFGNQIQDITLLKDLTQISSLNLSENQISDITPLTGLRQIVRLEMSGNRIQDIAPLIPLTHITYLDLSGNEIHDISALEGLTDLKRLYLNTNQITDTAPLVNLEKLEVLWISGNPITDLTALRTLRQQNPDVTIDLEFHQLVAATGTTFAVAKPSDLNPNNFTLQPGEFAILARTGQSDVSPIGDFSTYHSYYSVNQNGTNADLPNLAQFFQNGGRIELIIDTNQNPLPSGTESPDFGDLGISEIMWGLDGTSPNKQWIELYNASRHTYTFADGGLSLRFSDTSVNPLPDETFTPGYDTNGQVKVIDRVSNIGNITNRKNWNVPGQSGNTSQNRPLISMYRQIDYTTRNIPDGTRINNWRASSGRVNFSPPSYGSPGSEHLPPAPTVLIDVSERPPMFWVDASTGRLQRLTSNTVEQLLPNAQNATAVVVDTPNGKVYWIEKTGNTSGKIQSANIDGSNLQVIKRLTSVPQSIAIDNTKGKLYIANAWGKVQRLNVDGSNFQASLITGLNSPKNITIDTENRKIYWSEGANLKRANLNGSNRQRIATGSGPLTGIALDGSKIYWTERSKASLKGGKIKRANLNGSKIEKLVTINSSVPLGIGVDIAGRKLYWTNSHGKIKRAELNGSHIEDVVTGSGTPEHFNVGSSLQLTYSPTGTVVGTPAIYWSDRQAATIRRVSLNNLKVDDIVTGTPESSAIALDLTSGQVYWTETETGKIRRAALNGTNAEDILTGLAGPQSIALDVVRGKIYWTSQKWDSSTGSVTESSVQRANLNGSNVEDLVTDAQMPKDIALDTAGGKMYWTDYDEKQILRANLNGSNVQPLVTGLAGPSDIVLDIARRKMYWTDQIWNPVSGGISESKIQRANFDGSNLQEIVSGFGEPTDIAFGISERSTGEPSATRPASDVNADGKVNNTDLMLVAAALGQNAPVNARLDVNGDGTVNAADLIVVLSNLDEKVIPAAPEMGSKLTTVDKTRIQAEIHNLLLENDGSLKHQRALAFLQSLLASATPQETRLLPNYPNPFNPETWIPYTLASGTDVQIVIYDAKGTLIRQLELGYQPEGYYTERDRAAYWDGRNVLGERVASGIYFYQLKTDNASALRKMLILK